MTKPRGKKKNKEVPYYVSNFYEGGSRRNNTEN